MNIAQVILSLPFKTRNADEFVDENILSLFVDPTDGVAGPFDYRNEIIKGKMGTGKTMYLRANYIYHLAILVPQMIERKPLILPLYLKLSDFQNLHEPGKIYDQIIIRLIQEILNTCEKLQSANELVNLHNGFQNNVVGMWFNRVSQNAIVEKLNEITAEEYTRQVSTELSTQGTVGHNFLTACTQYGKTNFIELKKKEEPQIADFVFAYETLLRQIDCKLLILLDEVGSIDKSFFEEHGGASFFETLMNQLRTLDFVRTKIAVYPHTFADVLTETRYGDVILLEDDIYSPDGYKAFLNKTISIVEKYVGVVASDFESIESLFAVDKSNMQMLECFVLLFNGICQRRKSAQHSKSTCNCLATRAAATSAFSFSVLFIACCAATARERMRAGEMYGYADR